MSISTSVLSDLLAKLPDLRPQLYFKASLTALSHAMEDQVLAATLDAPLVIASFQRERFYRQEAHRYERLAQRSDQVYVLSAPETDFVNSSEFYEKVAFEPDDGLSEEWHLVVIAQNYATCLVCREYPKSKSNRSQIPATPGLDMDTARRFEGIWTSERGVSLAAADLLLQRIVVYRPELTGKIQQARERLGIGVTKELGNTSTNLGEYACDIDTDPFVQRLVTYLQASQYKLHKAYRSIAGQARKEQVINSISNAIRRSLKPQDVLKVAVQELGEHLGACRCFIYRAQGDDTEVTIEHEFLKSGNPSILGEKWQLSTNPLFQEIVCQREGICIADTMNDGRATSSPMVWKIVEKLGIRSWLIEPLLFQGQLLGIIELHYCGDSPHIWHAGELDIVNAIAVQIGVALIQAESFANLGELNHQLEALDRTRRNLIAITGHELRTPLSTIQVCLESLATEPDMPLELRQVMLSTALEDSERMRKLVQDFLTLSNLESGKIEWHPEPLILQECIDLALSRVKARFAQSESPSISTEITPNFPLVCADGDWLVEVMAKLIDNACKFTPNDGSINITAKYHHPHTIEVIVADTGRGIEPNRLEIVFDRFYQEEGALQRTAGGTGIGLAICRQIVKGWGGKIWAESRGKNQGSKFHFTISALEPEPEPSPPKKSRAGTKRKK